jgi:5'-nucleotidase
MNGMGLDLNAVGNHEFDEGEAELLRMQRGGCHPTDGCYDDPDRCRSRRSTASRV